ncbi:MAG: hypothetical protein WCO84_09965 [bacterium]
MFIESPKDGFIAEILVTENSVVKAGTKILRFNSDEEEKEQSRTKTLEYTRITMLKRLDPKQLQTSRRIAEIAIELAQKNIEIKKSLATFYQNGAMLGKGDDAVANASKYENEYEQAVLEKEKAEMQLKILDFTKDIDLEVDTILKAQFAKELTFLENKIKRLEILAPIDGNIKLLVSVGSFVKLGNIIAEIK